VVPQTLRSSVPVLEHDAQGPGLNALRHRDRSVLPVPAEQHLFPPEFRTSGADGPVPRRPLDPPPRPCRNRIRDDTDSERQ
jgi:hypothetical protein